MATVGKPWAVVLVVAVLSRLMSTEGRPLRLQQQQQQRMLDQNPELDIDRTYELMNEKRDRIQHRPHHQLALKPAVTPNDDGNDEAGGESRLGGDSQRPGSTAGRTAAAAVNDGRSVVVVPPSRAVAVAAAPAISRNASTAPVHSPAPKYHYEVHSVQHNPEKYNTADRKLQAVVREAASVEYRLPVHDNDIIDTLIDNSQLHYQRLMAARSAVRTDSEERKLAAMKERRRLEQIRHIEDEQDQEAREDESDVYDDETYVPVDDGDKLVQSVMSGKIADDKKSAASDAVVQVQVTNQNAEAVGESDKPEVASSLSREADAVRGHDDSLPEALALQSDGSRRDNWEMANGARSASSIADIYFFAVVIGCSVAGISGFMFAGICWYRLHKKMKEAGEVDYPAYGVTGPATTTAACTKGPSIGGGAGSPGDRKLAQSAQMYHYQHQKQQMIASERLGNDANGGNCSDVESEEENEDGDYTVFECPGLATNGEMEVRNPMFSDPTPVGTPADASGLYQQTRK